MKPTYIQILSIVLAGVYGLFVIFLYAAEPRSFEEIGTKARTTIENAATKGQVIAGTYEVDAAKFADGLAAFRAGNYVSARDLFQRADPESRDAATQFYIAYSFYRQGWGRFSSDDELFRQGQVATDRVITIDRDFRSADADLKLRTPVELRAEFDEGLKVTADDFNPLRIARERK